MKKSLTKLALFLFALSLMLTACGGDNEGGDPPTDEGTDIKNGVHYESDSDVHIVVGDGAERDTVNSIKKLFGNLYGYYPKQIKSTDEEKEYEIILGDCDREIAKKAATMLKDMSVEDGILLKYLILAEDGQIAIAFDSLYLSSERLTALEYAVDLFVEHFTTKGDIDVENGVLLSGSVDIFAIKQVESEEIVNKAWQNLYISLAIYPERDKVYNALREYYTLYDKNGLVTWFAGLYDPEIGGYYYSNSARDNDQFKPDAESTSQALGFISASGLAMCYDSFYGTAIPDVMKAEIISFIKPMQDPNGFFYHKQWTKEATDANIPRRSRDLGSCVSILRCLGSAPTYDTPTGVKGDGLLVDGTPVSREFLTPSIYGASLKIAASKVILSASYAPHLENDATFRAYLDKLLQDYSSGLHFYFIGNQLTSEMAQIVERDRQLAEEGADYSLVKILIEWLNSHQNPENGLWESETNYLGVNGLLKISGIYSSAKVEMPNADKAAISAINAITSNENVGAVVDIYNTWFAVRNVFNNMSEYGKPMEVDGAMLTAKERVEAMRASIIENADVYIKATHDKLALFKKQDGSFSYTQNMTSPYSQSMPVALPVNEGDVNATVICTHGTTSLMLEVLKLPVPPILTEADRLMYMHLIQQNRENYKNAR